MALAGSGSVLGDTGDGRPQVPISYGGPSNHSASGDRDRERGDRTERDRDRDYGQQRDGSRGGSSTDRGAGGGRDTARGVSRNSERALREAIDADDAPGVRFLLAEAVHCRELHDLAVEAVNRHGELEQPQRQALERILIGRGRMSHSAFRPMAYALRQRKYSACLALMEGCLVAPNADETDALQSMQVRFVDIADALPDGTTMLQLAAEWGNETLVSALLTYKQGFTSGHTSWCAGGDVNAHLSSAPSVVFSLCAQDTERPDLLRLVLQAKGNVSVTDHMQNQPLHVASARGHAQLVTLLLQYNANVGARNKYGQSPLHMACWFGQRALAQLLKQNGASHADLDQDGRTPLQYAWLERDSRRDTIKQLRASLADNDLVSAARSLRQLGVVIGAPRPAFVSEAGAPESVPPSSNGSTLELTDVHPTSDDSASAGAGGNVELRRFSTGGSAHGHQRSRTGSVTVQQCVGYLSTPHDSAVRAQLTHHLTRLEQEQTALDEVIEQALHDGGNINHEDYAGNKLFSRSAKLQWFQDQYRTLAMLVCNPYERAHEHPEFEDPRTQEAVHFQWKLAVLPSALRRLFMWMLFMLLILTMGILTTGRNSMAVNALQTSVNKYLANAVWSSDYALDWFDLDTSSDFWSFMSGPFTDAVFGDALAMRMSGSNTTVFEYEPGIASFNYFVGRPRIRQVRTTVNTCTLPTTTTTVGVNSTVLCFEPYEDGYINTEPFDFGGVKIPYATTDSVDYDGFVATYPGSGHSIMVPFEKETWNSLLSRMQNNYYIDGNTRFVVIELAVYNPGINMFCVVQMGVEFLSTGGVLASTKIQSLDLFEYKAGHTTGLIVVQVLASVILAYFLWEEGVQMTESWPLQREVIARLIAERKPIPRLRKGGLSELRGRLPTFGLPYPTFFPPSSSGGRLRAAFRAALNDASNWRGEVAAYLVGKQYETSFGGSKSNLAPENAFRVFYIPIMNQPLYIAWWDSKVIVPPYFYNPNNAVDALLLSLACALFVLQFLIISNSTTLEKQLFDFNQYVNVFTLADLVARKAKLTGALMFIGSFKMLEYLRVHRSLSTFILVIQQMLWKLVTFFAVLFVCIVAFAVYDYLVYGFLISDSRTMGVALFNQLTEALKEPDYTRVYDSSPFWGVLVTSMFTLLISIVLLNLLIAVMGEAYSEVNERAQAIWCATQFAMIQTEEALNQMDVLRSFINMVSCNCCCRSYCKGCRRTDTFDAHPVSQGDP